MDLTLDDESYIDRRDLFVCSILTGMFANPNSESIHEAQLNQIIAFVDILITKLYDNELKTSMGES